ncbi:MAG: hypothetical protein U0235_15610 [Polyangiaceae bacterium]
MEARLFDAEGVRHLTGHPTGEPTDERKTGAASVIRDFRLAEEIRDVLDHPRPRRLVSSHRTSKGLAEHAYAEADPKEFASKMSLKRISL